MDELQQIRDMGFRQPVVVIPNGVHCPDRSTSEHTSGNPPPVSSCSWRAFTPRKVSTPFFRQWKTVSHEFPLWTLRIAGPLNHSYGEQMQRLAAELQLPRVEFIGEVSGERKQDAWREADLYVLPTHSENFGISVAEALANGVPTIVTKGAPWEGVIRERAGWWIDHGEDALLQALRTAMSEEDESRCQMGENGRCWMRREFDWRCIGQRMAEFYQWLVHGGPAPGTVVFD
jgi:glycosyltransferase involved in cell wall biosynthesis